MTNEEEEIQKELMTILNNPRLARLHRYAGGLVAFRRQFELPPQLALDMFDFVLSAVGSSSNEYDA